MNSYLNKLFGMITYYGWCMVS